MGHWRINTLYANELENTMQKQIRFENTRTHTHTHLPVFRRGKQKREEDRVPSSHSEVGGPGVTCCDMYPLYKGNDCGEGQAC
jgi:hypothetical protein